ncbi:GPW/gp25 family protein [Rhizobium sp. WYJ-E13]|uniref:GPW/gp25 family protein n=1 Tax=Rhizobium sp. WYJ-E13 TaxID=2849093 RepID=UPI001C1ED678|nr:GPW/gp25 family protein [Rhizobium sp. WYJ-E13]QWW71209.1 GPW/gp25 family protein [Rhizobium sp. WYJ-E13]
MEEHKDFLGKGWAMPVGIDPRTGAVATAQHEDDIRQSIRIILETARGERIMRPDFGCGIHDMVFEAIDSTAMERIRSEIVAALRRYEARIEVNDVTIDDNLPSQGLLLIELEYRIRRTNQVGNLVFPFYFKEGSTS